MLILFICWSSSSKNVTTSFFPQAQQSCHVLELKSPHIPIQSIMCSFPFIQKAALHQSFTCQSSKMKTDFVVCTCSFKVIHNCFFFLSSDYSQRTLRESFLDTSKRRQVWKRWAVCKDYPHLLFTDQVWVIWVFFLILWGWHWLPFHREVTS